MLIADIRQAFLNIAIRKEDRDLLRFLFFDKHDNSKILTYRFKRGCFGVTSLPFMMCATIQYHMNCLKREQPDLVKLIEQFLRDLYMDDVGTAVDDYVKGVEFYDFAKNSMASAGFELRKWYSNSAELRNYMGCDKGSSMKSRKVLGLIWNIDDEFVFDLGEMVEYAANLPFTKKSILRFGAKYFDVPGFISPVIIIVKIYFQKVCIDKSKWDDKLSGDLEKGWTRYLQELGEIKRICVPRYLFPTIEGTVTNIQLHGFCDASEQAYCAVIFVTTVESENEFASRIVTSKTKVAPIKKHSIPWLELLSSLLLTELMQSLCTAIKDVVSKIFLV